MIQRKRQKKNEEMKREAELRKKYEENLDKPITITQRQFTEISAQVMTNGKFMSMAIRMNRVRLRSSGLRLRM